MPVRLLPWGLQVVGQEVAYRAAAPAVTAGAAKGAPGLRAGGSPGRGAGTAAAGGAAATGGGTTAAVRSGKPAAEQAAASATVAASGGVYACCFGASQLHQHKGTTRQLALLPQS